MNIEVETTLYRVVQEALTNIARHAQAQYVYLKVMKTSTAVKVYVEDDGWGSIRKRLENMMSPNRVWDFSACARRLRSWAGI